jgi:myo-inositol-1(or 4)-monophosphatase
MVSLEPKPIRPAKQMPNARQIDDNLLKQFLAASESAARKGGAILLELMGKAEVWEKGPGDLVTQADFRSQQAIRETLLNQFPDHRFLGEESETEAAESDHSTSDRLDPNELEFCWIVDPLDGTTNFVHQLRSFSVSIALCHRGQVIVGTVFDPTTDECFSAALGKGATLNGKPIRPSQRRELNQALVVFSMNSQLSVDDPQVKRFLQVLPHVSTFRRLGSAALNLCFVGCGRTDAYWATSLKIWDVAAGWLIATEAGAFLEDFEGPELNLNQPKFCVACNQGLFDQLKVHLRLKS